MLPTWDALQRLTAAVPRAASNYSTNLFAGRDLIQAWCARGRLRVSASDEAVLVLRADRDFHRVYHVARDLSALTEALLQLPPGRYTTDLVGRGNVLDQVCNSYAAGGFEHHTFLRRMSRSQAPASLQPDEEVVEAVPNEAEEVALFLNRLLDPLSEQLPDRDELGDAARDGRLLLARRGRALAGMLMYDVQGQSAHLRFWHVDPEAQGEGFGRRLMASFLSRCAEARRIVLWVIGDNERSIAIYRHYGFETDGLLDRIMIMNKDQH
jgi:ribosomal protein S18 acetylase RimI-like enzyme